MKDLILTIPQNNRYLQTAFENLNESERINKLQDMVEVYDACVGNLNIQEGLITIERFVEKHKEKDKTELLKIKEGLIASILESIQAIDECNIDAHIYEDDKNHIFVDEDSRLGKMIVYKRYVQAIEELIKNK